MTWRSESHWDRTQIADLWTVVAQLREKSGDKEGAYQARVNRAIWTGRRIPTKVKRRKILNTVIFVCPTDGTTTSVPSDTSVMAHTNQEPVSILCPLCASQMQKKTTPSPHAPGSSGVQNY